MVGQVEFKIVCFRTLCGCESLVRIESTSTEIVRPLRTPRPLPRWDGGTTEFHNPTRIFRKTSDRAIVHGTVFEVFEEVPEVRR